MSTVKTGAEMSSEITPDQMRIVADEDVRARDRNILAISVFEHDTTIVGFRASNHGLHAQVQVSKEDARNFAHAILRQLNAAERGDLPADPYFALYRLRAIINEARDVDADQAYASSGAYADRAAKFLRRIGEILDEQSRGTGVTARDAANATEIREDSQDLTRNRGNDAQTAGIADGCSVEGQEIERAPEGGAA